MSEWPSTATAAAPAVGTSSAPSVTGLYAVPPAGTAFVACWKHNLDFGAEAEVYDGGPDAPSLPAALEALALGACAALRLVYGAVDVVELDEGERWAVLEVNACPAWNHFLATHAQEAGRCIGAIVTTALRLQLT